MPRGSKAKYTNRQKRQAEHIEEGYKRRGLPTDEAERRAWATVNKIDRGGEKPGGGGYGQSKNRSVYTRAGKIGSIRLSAEGGPHAGATRDLRRPFRTG